ncbi:MAG: MarR family transcriptional regulator [Firmicutes bacterium]|nr:MarR family transcriptional regulator [Bacillota bacterium]
MVQGFFRHYFSLHRALISKLNELLAEYGLSYSLWTVIFYVKTHGSSTLVDIAHFYNVKKPVITRTVQNLEEKGIIRQIPGADKREKLVELTEAGEQIYKICRKLIDELEDEIMKNISEEEKAAIFESLPQIRANVLAIGGNNNEEQQFMD